MNWYRITSLDPLVFGDGRPFSSDPGSQIVSSRSMPLPGTVAGALRTAFGHCLGRFDPAELRNIVVGGPILEYEQSVRVPHPADRVLVSIDGVDSFTRSTPDESMASCVNLGDGLWPCSITDDVNLKPTKAKAPRYLDFEEALTWLVAPRDMTRCVGKEALPAREVRTHVGIDSGSLASSQGMLFRSEGVHFTDHIWSDTERQATGKFSLLVQVSETFPDSFTLHLGGERRIAVAHKVDAAVSNATKDKVREGLSGKRLVRLLLVTPALFTKGFIPAWDEVPGTNVRLRLRGAAVGRRDFVSGWDLAKRGPKEVRFLVPAGSVFFLEVVDGDAGDLADSLLTSVCDDLQDRKDGYGLGLWGVW